MKKNIKEALKKVDEHFELQNVDAIVEQMCGTKHLEEIENDIENAPADDMEEEMENIEKDIAETKKFGVPFKFALGESAYQDFFKATLAKFNVSSPKELSDDQKKEFFSKLETGWTKEKDK